MAEQTCVRFCWRKTYESAKTSFVYRIYDGFVRLDGGRAIGHRDDQE